MQNYNCVIEDIGKLFATVIHLAWSSNNEAAISTSYL